MEKRLLSKRLGKTVSWGNMGKDKKKKIIIGLISLALTAFEFFSANKLLHEDWGLLTLLLIPVFYCVDLFFISFFIVDYKNAKKKWKSAAGLVLVFLFGTLLIKSFIIYIYPLATMPMSTALLYGFGWSLVGTSLTYLLKTLLMSISWQGTEYSKKGLIKYLFYCIPSIIILGVVFAIYYPGVGTIDTLYIWNQIHANSYTDTHPLMLQIFYKGLSLIWDNIAVITVFQYIICTLAFGYVAYYFSGKGLKKAWSWAIAIALPLLPINAFYSVMLWKDIPYSIGLMLFIVLTIKVLEDGWLKKSINILWFVLVGLFVMFVRHNGFIPILGTIGLLGLYFLIKKHFKTIFKLAAGRGRFGFIVLWHQNRSRRAAGQAGKRGLRHCGAGDQRKL